MTLVSDLHKESMKRPGYREEYEALEPEFELAQAMIEARASAGLTQAELARKMKTKQSVIARLESGRVSPSGKTLRRLAKATKTHVKISFEPITSS